MLHSSLVAMVIFLLRLFVVIVSGHGKDCRIDTITPPIDYSRWLCIESFTGIRNAERKLEMM